jgi:quinol-cytochrome oxidoreductase complex cytochrome b subunit
LAYLILHLGRITFLLFLFNAISGILLAFYYQPSSSYHSVWYITKNVEFGVVIRSVHHWSAHLLIFFLIMHFLRSLLQGRYKVSRRSWIVGCLMGMIVLTCSFTGCPLIGDQRGYWMTVIGMSIVENIPLVGLPLKTFLLGGPEPNPSTIGRFYALHTLMLPGLLTAFIVFHLKSFSQLWMCVFDFTRRLGIVGASGKDYLDNMDASAYGGFLFELMEIFSTIGVILLLALLFPPGIGQKANPLVTPLAVKPEWYFLFIYQGLKHLPKQGGAVLFLLALPVLMVLLPLIDRSPALSIHPVHRPWATVLVFIALVTLLSLTVLGWLA